jgi:cyclic pyranopterin phosphate synthase
MNPIPYLRLSITDQCNFNCFYCQPSSRDSFFEDGDLLTCMELRRIVRHFTQMGVRHVRLTGGEPLVRPDARELIRDLAELPSLERLTLTTNGYLLTQFSEVLREGLLSGINVSLDTLDRAKFSRIVGRDALPMVKNGIMSAREAGVPSIKLNVLLIRGFNDGEICALSNIFRLKTAAIYSRSTMCRRKRFCP